MGIFTETIKRGYTDTVRKEDEINDKEVLTEEVVKNQVDGKVDIDDKLKTLLKRIKSGAYKDLFGDIEDNEGLLSDEQMLLLKACLALPFKLGAFSSLEDILNKLDVNVMIEPGTKTRKAPLELYEEKISLEQEVNRTDIDKDLLDEARERLAETKEKIQIWELMKLRGEYIPDEKKIKLYPEEMKKEYKGKKMNELLVSTLVHETMHAYFYRPLHNHLPYYASIEEPMAEFGMLVFLHENKISYYDWAYTDVSQKKTCYRYGTALMEQYKNEGGQSSQTRKDLVSYKTPLY